MPDPKKLAKKELFGTKNDTIAPKRGTKNYNVHEAIESTGQSNKAKVRNELFAKNDSISASKTAKSIGKDLVDQRRAGNAAANMTRKKNNIPKVTRYRQTNAGDSADKYSPSKSGGLATTKDNYLRDAPVEKDMPKNITSKEVNQARTLTDKKNETNGYAERVNAQLFATKKKK